jgi:cation:H+ antiporter
MLLNFLILLGGLGLLLLGGDFIVKGAVSLSRKMRISPLVIGMTVVAFGTSAPELLVSLKSALLGNSAIAIGNVVGSNIANIALVLGLTALIFPIITDRQTKIIDYPVMLGATMLFCLFALDGSLSFVEGIIFVSIIVVFITLRIRNSRSKNNASVVKEEEPTKRSIWYTLLFLLLGFLGLNFGAGWFIEGAVSLSDHFLEGNPNKDTIIGVTVIAFGTSAPELAASCVAAYRREVDISVGNLIGSNIFNIFVVLGITSIVTPLEVSSDVMEFDMIWMIAIAILLLIILLVGKRIGRLKGAILFSTYLVYIGIILMRVNGIV